MSTSTGPSDVLTLSLAGQAMIRGDLRVDAPEAIADISALVQGDVAFTNFEAAVFDPTRGQGYRDGRFVSPPETIELLASVGFNVLSLANNHAFDMGAAGILNTVETADRLHLAHSGAGRTLAEVRDLIGADSLAYLSLDGLRLALRAGETGSGFCFACLDGAYPVQVPQQLEMDKLALEG